MASSPDGMRPTYQAFHAWLRSNRRKLSAGRHRTVIYSGLTSGNVPVGTMLPTFASKIYAETGCNPNWQPIEEILRSLKCRISDHLEGIAPPALRKCRTMWDFGCNCVRYKLVSKTEGQQIWRNLSAWYVKNAKGQVWIIEGERLKKYPDMLMTEIAVLSKKKNMSPDTIEKLKHYIPDIAVKWEQYRKDSVRGRMTGR